MNKFFNLAKNYFGRLRAPPAATPIPSPMDARRGIAVTFDAPPEKLFRLLDETHIAMARDAGQGAHCIDMFRAVDMMQAAVDAMPDSELREGLSKFQRMAFSLFVSNSAGSDTGVMCEHSMPGGKIDEKFFDAAKQYMHQSGYERLIHFFFMQPERPDLAARNAELAFTVALFSQSVGDGIVWDMTGKVGGGKGRLRLPGMAIRYFTSLAAAKTPYIPSPYRLSKLDL